MDLNEYLELPTSCNLDKPKFMAYLEAVLTPAVQLGDVNESIGDAFDITNAAGNQLDILGELVGVDRLLPYTPLVGTREMSDEEYRVILMMKIFRNEWDGTMDGAVKIYQSAFQNIADISFYDDGVCHVVVSVREAEETRIANILDSTDTLLIPEGVSKTVNVYDNGVAVDFTFGTGVISAVCVQSVYTESNFDRDTVYHIGNTLVSEVEERIVGDLET